MKTSNVLATVLFSTMALAAPLDRRAYATKTEIKMEYYTVYTTVTGAQPAAAAATSDPALFYEDKPKHERTSTTTSAIVIPSTSTSATSTVVAPEPTKQAPTTTAPTGKGPEPTSSTTSSVYTAPPVVISTTAPPAAPVSTSTSTQAPPPSSTSSIVAAPAPTQTSSGGGQSYSGGSFTMNYYGDALGACGDPVKDTDMAVALGVDVFGTATVNPATGKTTNPWCGKKIQVTNNGKTAIAYIKDRCIGCTGSGLDATPALWEATTGGLGGASGDRIYSMSWKVVE